MYHGFGTRPAEADPFNLFVPVEDFERHLQLIKRYLKPLDLAQFIAHLPTRKWPRRSVLVTMDDGYRSVLTEAAPRLRAAGIPAVAFVCPGRFGGESSWMEETSDEPLLTAEEVAQLPEFGFDVGVHSMDHTRMPGISPEELRRQVGDARDALAEVMGERSRAFAYPEGLWDPAAVEAVRHAGYETAFSVDDCSDDEGSDRFTVTRTAINTRDSQLTFLTKLVPGFAKLERMSKGSPRLRRMAARLAGQRDRTPDSAP
jgi:peptidoglycan/xylan/chitin deacetylase (PgdA/CDA1 family)